MYQFPLALLDVSPTGFQIQTLWGLVFSMQVTQAGGHSVGLRPEGGLCSCDILPTCGLSHQGYGFHQTASLPLLQSPCGLFFNPQLQKFCSACLQVVLRDSCSICGCSFSVSMGEGELRIFILCYLERDLELSTIKFQLINPNLTLPLTFFMEENQY